MARAREADLRVRGMGLMPRFALSMTAALTLVMAIAGATLYGGSSRLATRRQNEALSDAVRTSYAMPAPEERQQVGDGKLNAAGVQIFEVRYGNPPRPGHVYKYRPPGKDGGFFEILVPDRSENALRGLLGMIVAIMIVVVMVGAGVALWVASQVTQPVKRIIEDVRNISRGDLQHRTHVVGGGEIELLARSIDRMTRDLEAAQGTKLELSIREREMELSAGIQEALLPLTTPLVEGYDIGAVRMSSAGFGGDFHDYVELEDGRVGLLVCDVSGQGVPAALIGATARSYLRSELARAGDPADAFRRVNRWIAQDVRRGMFVTALYALLDPARGSVSVLSAGHKLPLLRYTAADGKLRLVHPEGLALGLDRGAVFDRRIELQELEMEPGDRLLLSNSAPARLENAEGRELGEKGFYARVLKHAGLPTEQCLKALRRDLEQFAAGEDFPLDVSLVTILRER